VIQVCDKMMLVLVMVTFDHLSGLVLLQTTSNYIFQHQTTEEICSPWSYSADFVSVLCLDASSWCTNSERKLLCEQILDTIGLDRFMSAIAGNVYTSEFVHISLIRLVCANLHMHRVSYFSYA
jgi:hypothetical protein